MLERKINIGGIYRHFKGTHYKVIAVAKDSETLEEKVVYTNVDTEATWIRPIDEFLSLVDKNKYPNIKQKYRFEEVN